MQIKTKAFLFGTALALVLGLNNAMAQGVVSLADDDDSAQTLDLGLADNEIPNSISLADEDDDGDLIVPPQKSQDGPHPINLAEAPQPINLAEGPKPINLGEAPQPINLGEAPQPINLGDGPKPINLADGPRPIGAEGPMIIDNGSAPKAPQAAPAPKPGQQVSPVGAIGAAKFGNIDGTIFEKMSDLEKQTAILSLELRKEKVQNEIEAVKSQRTKAMEELRAAEEEKAKKKAEWEREQVLKVIKEQQRLKELETAYENARQEKLLNDYKNHMLKEKQSWIEKNASLYAEMKNATKEKIAFADKIKNQYKEIDALSAKAKDDAARVKEAYAQEISDLQAQVSLLKSRLEAQERALEEERQNPFAESAVEGDGDSAPVTPTMAVERLDELYAVMEIRGQGDKLSAKLMNQSGIPFIVRKGAVLQNGEMVDEITSSYVRTDKNGAKDYLYFSGSAFWGTQTPDSDKKEEKPSGRPLMVEDDIPSIGKDMIVK